MKKTLIATAVSTALMAPIAVQAEPEVTVYGRIHQGIWHSKTDGSDATTDFGSGGSRFGIKASSDLGNGLTASAQYEFTTHPDSSGATVKNAYDGTNSNLGVSSTRVGTVGISGSFGSVTIGNQWGAYYNNVPYLDPTHESIGVVYYQKRGSVGTVYRTAKTVKYSNTFGPVSIELDARPVDTDPNNEYRDGYAAGATFNLNDNISFSGAYDKGNNAELAGFQGKLSLGNYWTAIAWHSADMEAVPAVAAVPATPGNLGKAAVTAKSAADVEVTQFWVGGSFGNTKAMLGMGEADMDMGKNTPGNEPGGISLGIYHDLGGGLTLMYEGGKLKNDGMGADVTDHWFGVKFDF